MSKLKKLPKTIKVRQPVKPKLTPRKLAADLLKFAQWADCDETSNLEHEFLEVSRDESTGSQCHFLEALLFLRLASVSLYHAKHQAQFATQWSRCRTLSPDDVEAWLANSSLKLAQKCLRDVAGVEQAIVNEIPE